jgi:ATP-dependent Zn protease
MHQGLLLLIFVILLIVLSYLLMSSSNQYGKQSNYYSVKKQREDEMSSVLKYKLGNNKGHMKNDHTIFKSQVCTPRVGNRLF